jgi:hypothetical protein
MSINLPPPPRTRYERLYYLLSHPWENSNTNVNFPDKLPYFGSEYDKLDFFCRHPWEIDPKYHDELLWYSHYLDAREAYKKIVEYEGEQSKKGLYFIMILEASAFTGIEVCGIQMEIPCVDYISKVQKYAENHPDRYKCIFGKSTPLYPCIDISEKTLKKYSF